MKKDNNIDLGGLSMDKLFDGVIAPEIKFKSPAFKINIDLDNTLFVVGFNLMCMQQDKIKYDLSDLNDDTLISIDKHHMIECILIIAGAIHAASMITKVDMSGSNYIDKIRKRVGVGLVYKRELDKIARSISGYLSYANNNQKYDKLIEERLKYIINNIWFLPYGEIDKIKDQINKDLAGGDKNE